MLYYFTGLKLREKSVIVSDEQATSITLTCDANAYPEPSFSWTRMTPAKEEVEPGLQFTS